MAGHSKWANIKHRKGKADAQRGKMFTKFSRYITVAAKEGGADVEYNSALKSAIDKAKAENMPNDNIEKAIKRGIGGADGANYEEIKYEGYGPSGTAVIVECLTDNRNRTASDVRHAFDKFGGNLGATGCVSWQFERKGIIVFDKIENVDEDEITMEVIELGAEDFTIEEDYFEVLTAPEDVNIVKEKLLESGKNILNFDITYISGTNVELTDESDIKNMVKMINTLEDNDDVQKVYHNWDMPENLEI